MTFWDRLIYDPSSFLHGKKWWQVALMILPWFLLVLVGSCLWFVAPGRLMSRYVEFAKNAPLDKVNEGAEMQLKELEARRQELAEKSRNIETKIAGAREQFEMKKKRISTATHDELTNRLYGKEDSDD
jgi:hypothetical protein